MPFIEVPQSTYQRVSTAVYNTLKFLIPGKNHRSVLNEPASETQSAQMTKTNVETRGRDESVLQITQNLHRKILGQQTSYLSEDGLSVDYNALAKSKEFEEFVEQTAILREIKLSTLSDDERVAFFLNVYNMLTVQGLSTVRPSSVLFVKNFWENTCYNIGGEVYSLDIIEHGVLRKNGLHPLSKGYVLENNDPRANLLSKVDPRIHFALNCGAKSCPPIRIYSAKNLEGGLHAATLNFVAENVKVDMSKRQINISPIFQWYRLDFGETIDDVVDFIYKHLPDASDGTLRRSFEKVMEESQQGKCVKIGYLPYNWGLNISA
eukprot:CFRG0958T1